MDDAGGDGQDSMDERDPDVTVPLASLDQRYLGEESFGRDEVHSEHRQRAWTCHITNGVPQWRPPR